MIRVLLLLIISSLSVSLAASGINNILGSPLRGNDEPVLRSSQENLYVNSWVVVPTDDGERYGIFIGREPEDKTSLRVSLGENDSYTIFQRDEIKRLPLSGEPLAVDDDDLRDIEVSDLKDGQWIVQKFDGYSGTFWAQFSETTKGYAIYCGWGEEVHASEHSKTALEHICESLQGSYYVLKK